jgi:hypothetical protein
LKLFFVFASVLALLLRFFLPLPFALLVVVAFVVVVVIVFALASRYTKALALVL